MVEKAGRGGKETKGGDGREGGHKAGGELCHQTWRGE